MGCSERLRRLLILGVVFLVGLSCAGCEQEGRLYNLTTGEVTPAKFTYSGSGKGKITALLPSGEQLKGEYVTFARMPANWGSTFAAVYGTAGTAYSGAASGSKANQYGTAIVSGDRGFVGDCEYVVRGVFRGTGTGACKDKQGTLYKLMF
jgi:hypothetical protein